MDSINAFAVFGPLGSIILDCLGNTADEAKEEFLGPMWRAHWPANEEAGYCARAVTITPAE
jgi:hypothetical protein